MATVELVPACRDVRRSLGTLAWAVLEDVALDADDDGTGCLVARTSARGVATHLGIQPDTAARALKRLRVDGLLLLVREQRADGRFGLSVYQVTAVPGMVVNGVPPQAVQPHTAEPNTAEEPTVPSSTPLRIESAGQQSLWSER